MERLRVLMVELPAGTVTFLFTDVEGSTRLLDELEERYAAALADHRLVLQNTCPAHGGVLVDTQGDATFYVFPAASMAVAAARQAQRELEIPVRMGIHTGEPQITDNRYVGMDVHRAARICAAAHGGQVLVSETTAQLAGDELRDLGVHRLKDVGELRLYQLGEGSFPPPRTLSATNLPTPATPLLGRKKELADVLKLLGGDARLVTVTGPGGVGKTRFALEVAAALVEGFRDGVWFVDLSALRDAELVLPTITGALGAKGEVAEHVGDKALLLCLDNFEQVARAAAEVGKLLERCRRLRLLVTSREPLHVRGEREYPLHTLAEAPAVELFRQRAQAIDPRFDADYAQLAELCRRLDNLPLAIELAVARTRTLSAAQLVERLEKRLPLLTGSKSDLPKRQRTLRATIEWSYDLLSPQEQQLFRRLSTFAGGFTLEAAEEVADADLDTLGSLVEKSLVRREGERFTMLEMIREFALERLGETADNETAGRRHAEWFLGLAEQVDEAFATNDSTQKLLLVNQAEQEVDNLRAAVTWYLERSAVEPGLRFVDRLLWFWVRTDRIVEGRTWGERALALRGEADQETRARALSAVGSLSADCNDFPRATELLDQALCVFRELDDKLWIAKALDRLADLHLSAGELNAARARYEESLALFTELGRKHDIATATHGLGAVHRDAGNSDIARRFLVSAAEMYRQQSYLGSLAATLHGLGDLELDERRLTDAEQCYTESLSLIRDLGLEKRLVIYCLAGLAGVAAARGDAERAGSLWYTVERVEKEIGVGLGRSERARYERLVRQVSGPAFNAGACAGRKVPLARAVEYALSLE